MNADGGRASGDPSGLPDHLRFLVLILFGLGLRTSEALALKWKDIDFRQDVITIQRRWYRGDLSEEGATKNEGPPPGYA